MRKQIFLITAVIVLVFAGLTISDDTDHEKKKDILAGTIEGLLIDNILTSELELVDGVEVVVSHIVIPPNTELPKHWHHGEEFGYVIEGSLLFWQEGQEEVPFNKGDIAKIPLKEVHSVRTTDLGATILVFRVHEKGKPVRVLVE